MARLILHVDDDPELPEGIVETLEAEGYEWLRSVDPEAVMRVVEERDPALVLMEIDLANCDGLDLLSGILSAREGAVPVLVLTRVPRDSGLHGEAIALGVTDFLSKPVRFPELLGAVRELAVPPQAPEEPTVAPSSAPSAEGDLAGEIADTPVPELLARLRRRGAGGVLKLRQSDRVVGIQLRNGTPICVGSKRRGDAPGAAARGAEDQVFDTFGWTEGTWEFFAGRRLSPGTAAELASDPASLLLRGVLAACPVERARASLRKRETLYVSACESQDETLEDVDLTPQQTAILEELCGQESLADLLASMAFEERMLYGLWVAGWIELHAVPTLDLVELYGEASPPEIELDQPWEAPSADAPTVGAAPPGAAAPQRSPAPERPDDREEMSRRLRELAQEVMAGDDFAALDVDVDASEARLRDAYRERLGQIPRAALEGADLELRARAERIRDRIESAYAHLEDPERRRAYALLRKEESEDRKAENAAERALEGERWFRKGRGHLEHRRHEQAAEAFGMAAHLDPGEGEYLAHLGYALFLSKPGDKVVAREAMEHVANGIKRSPTRDISYVYLGRILKARGDEEAALKLFRKALRIKPDCHPALQEVRLLEMRAQKKGKGLLSRLLGS